MLPNDFRCQLWKGVNAMPISLEVWGDYALFTRPEMKTERVSYDVMTPSAARGLIEAIYWHPGLRWVIDRIHVCAPIRFSTCGATRSSPPSPPASPAPRWRAAGASCTCAHPTTYSSERRCLLRDVRYVIEAHFDILPERPRRRTTRENSRTSPSAASAGGNSTTSPASAAGNSPPNFAGATNCRPARRTAGTDARSGLDALRHGTTPTPRT